MHELVETVAATIRRHSLLEAGDNVFVALSGGADSVSLLHALIALQDELKLSSVHALHVHHGLRGKTADRDETFVRELCERLQIPLSVSHVNTRAYAQEHHRTIEEAGRTLRYAFFEDATKPFSRVKIATAHTLDDVAETVLLNISRGCGLQGAGGIPVRRGQIVRPLIDCTATQVRSFCTEQNIPYVLDETNSDLCYARNRVRAEVLPTLAAIHPDAARSMARFAELAREENTFLDAQASVLLQHAKSENGYRVDSFESADPVLVRRALILAVKAEEDCPLERTHIDALCQLIQSEGSVNLPQNLRAVCRRGLLRFDRLRTGPVNKPAQTPVHIGQTIRFGEDTFEIVCLSRKEYEEKRKIHKNLFYFCLSYDMISNGLCLRSREAGDTLRPYGRGCRKQVKKWFQEAAIPAYARMTIPLVADEQGILAILGYTVDERAAVKQDTTTIVWFKKIS